MTTQTLPKRFPQSFAEGVSVEQVFVQSARAAKYHVEYVHGAKSILSHIDVWLRSNRLYGVDIKGMKRLARSGDVQDQYVCIELHGAEHKGWLYGGLADLIAFETQDCFLLVYRKRLAEAMPILVTGETVEASEEAIYKIYSRRDQEQITWIETAMLQNSWLLFGTINKV